MTELRLATACAFHDRGTETEYIGPGTFDVPEDETDRLLERIQWERGGDFDAADWLDVPSAVAETRIETGAHDDRLDALREAENDGEQRARVYSAIQERRDKRSDRTGTKRPLSETRRPVSGSTTPTPTDPRTGRTLPEDPTDV